jgi:putative SOS response-associated peptidase YedK
MCVKLKGNKMTPGQVQAFLTKLGKASGVWGFGNGKQANVRMESLSTIWRKIQMNRGILSVESFWERDKEFVRKDGKLFQLAVIFNPEYEFAVMTVPALGIVRDFHHRMPGCLVDDQAENFIEGKLPVILHSTEIILAHSKDNVPAGRAA